MTAPSVEAATHELMDLAWNLVYDLLEGRRLPGDSSVVEEFTDIHSWLDGPTKLHRGLLPRGCRAVLGTRPVDAITFHQARRTH
ncbi:hypothetical protein [Arthrobacter sp. B1I2]|uniref:hypothetical protein n=1 Tax=Arthrobacter sp. B1I2 TaxID=3042263 RepID=UPI002781FCBD|nr:hypothetical protein [Arthrobacter sp. B1I2]MDQ0732201.1 hypothetical protein [Arthrobacter sp. B1I2]